MELIKKTNELDIAELKVVEYYNGQYVAENREEATQCEQCHFTHIQYKNTHLRKLLDVLIFADGSRLIDLIHRHKHFVCLSSTCGKHVEKRITFAEKNHDYTCRLERYLFNRCLICPASTIESELGGRISDTSIKKIFSDFARKLDKTIPKRWETPKVMGIHAEKIKGIRFWMVTNVDKECLVDVLPDCREETITNLFKRFTIGKIEQVWIDMDDQLLMSVRSLFPKEKIMVGRYQLERLARGLLRDEIKKGEKLNRPAESAFIQKEHSILSKKTAEKLDAYLATNDEIKRLYELYWELPKASKSQIESIIEEAKNNPGLGSSFGWVSTITNFNEYIKHSLDSTMINSLGDDVTKVYFDLLQEAIEEKLEKTRRCSFKVMRARILYSDRDMNEEFKYICGEFEPIIKKTKTENTMYCECLIDQNYMFMDLETTSFKRRITVGQPLREVANRLEWLANK